MVLFVSKVLQAMLRNSLERDIKTDFLNKYTQFVYELVQKEDGYENGMLLAVDEICSIIKTHLNFKKKWTGKSLIESAWADLISK